MFQNKKVAKKENYLPSTLPRSLFFGFPFFLVAGSSQHGFMEGKSCFRSLTAFNNEMIGLLGSQGIPVNAAYIGFCKFFNTVLSSYTS